MKKNIFVLLQNLVFSQILNENLTSVHYSIASVGIDDEIKPGKRISRRIYSTRQYSIGRLRGS